MTFVSRAEWGADWIAPRGNTVHPNNRTHFVVHHSTGDNLGQPDPKAWVKSIFNYHVFTNGNVDIGYNFLVDWNGNIYEGRGWDKSGACQYGMNTAGWCVVVLGNSSIPGNLTEAAKIAVRSLAEEADFKAGKSLIRWGHRDVPGNSTACPGDEAYDWIHAGMPLQMAVRPNESGKLLLVVADSGKVLGVDGESTDNGVAINQWALHGRPAQLWTLTAVPGKDGAWWIRNVGADKMLSADLAPGRNILTWEWQPDAEHNQWRIHGVGHGGLIVQVSSGLEIAVSGPEPKAQAHLVEAGKGDIFVGVWLDG